MKTRQNSQELTVWQQLRLWFGEPLGQSLRDIEHRRVSQLLPDMFGYHIVQLGCLHGGDFINASRISHKVIIRLHGDGQGDGQGDIICRADALPLATDSTDVIFVPHVLEFTESPHRLLREVARVLIGEGHMVICGFNPWSLWGIWRLFLVWRELPPWCGHFFGLARLKDWLTLLDFELVSIEKCFYRPPLKNLRVMQKLEFMEKLGKYCWPYFGGAYIIVARKRVVPLTPIKMKWKEKRRLLNAGLVEPSTRTGNSP